MTPHQIARARRKLSLVGRTRASLPFFYCAAAEDGDPVLLLDEEQIPLREVLEVTRTARRKIFIQGMTARCCLPPIPPMSLTLSMISVGDWAMSCRG